MNTKNKRKIHISLHDKCFNVHVWLKTSSDHHQNGRWPVIWIVSMDIKETAQEWLSWSYAYESIVLIAISSIDSSWHKTSPTNQPTKQTAQAAGSMRLTNQSAVPKGVAGSPIWMWSKFEFKRMKSECTKNIKFEFKPVLTGAGVPNG